jgi:hypothetical protein
MREAVGIVSSNQRGQEDDDAPCKRTDHMAKVVTLFRRLAR